MPFKKGKSGNPAGKKPGTPNKATKQLKEMILAALDAAGGETYLQGQATETPTAFMSLLGRVLPTQLTGKDDAPLNLGAVTVHVHVAAGTENQT